MSDDEEYKVNEPVEGAGTLVAQFSVFQIDLIVTELKELREKGMEDTDLFLHLASRAADLDEGSRLKVMQLSRGETPDDDFGIDDIERLEKLDDSKFELQLKSLPVTLEEGSLVYYHGMRWIVTVLDRSKNHITIKHL